MPCSKTNGASKIIEEGEKLFSKANAYINGLNAEPGCYAEQFDNAPTNATPNGSTATTHGSSGMRHFA